MAESEFSPYNGIWIAFIAAQILIYLCYLLYKCRRKNEAVRIRHRRGARRRRTRPTPRPVFVINFATDSDEEDNYNIPIEDTLPPPPPYEQVIRDYCPNYEDIPPPPYPVVLNVLNLENNTSMSVTSTSSNNTSMTEDNHNSNSQ